MIISLNHLRKAMDEVLNGLYFNYIPYREQQHRIVSFAENLCSVFLRWYLSKSKVSTNKISIRQVDQSGMNLLSLSSDSTESPAHLCIIVTPRRRIVVLLSSFQYDINELCFHVAQFSGRHLLLAYAYLSSFAIIVMTVTLVCFSSIACAD